MSKQASPLQGPPVLIISGGHMDIYAYTQVGSDGSISYYCEDDALTILFHGDTEMLERVKGGTDITFKDANGASFGLIHDGTVQYESYPGEIIPLEGITCSVCGEELYPAFEEEDA